MKIDEFKSHTITRSSPKPKNKYSYYKNDLRQDFCGRCAYCNLSDDSITTPFEIDHFITKTAFKDIRPELLTDYNNLIYSCKKCNNAKRGQFSGDLSVSHPTNELFYDPVLVDYNNIFYRNELGAIASDDAKGKHMIEILKLYRPIHILGWLCEKILLSLRTRKVRGTDYKQVKLNVKHSGFIKLQDYLGQCFDGDQGMGRHRRCG